MWEGSCLLCGLQSESSEFWICLHTLISRNCSARLSMQSAICCDCGVEMQASLTVRNLKWSVSGHHMWHGMVVRGRGYERLRLS